MLGFAALALLSDWAWPGHTVRALAALLVYGGLIEVLQSLTPDNSADLVDVVADGIGLAIGVSMAQVIAVLARKRRR